MIKDLRQFLHVVREAGPDFYVEVNKQLKPKHEPCVIQEKLAKEGRFPVISCPEIKGSKLLDLKYEGPFDMGKIVQIETQESQETPEKE